MDEDEFAEFPDDEWEEGEMRRPRTDRRASQLISFPQDDLDAIRVAAQHAGLSTSDYIREATLERLNREQAATRRAR